MAQLSPDSFAFGGRLRRLDDALDDLSIRLAGLGETETVPVMQAMGRVLAHEVRTPFAIPDFENSAVDGYAVRFADLAVSGETHLPVSLRVPAGLIGVPCRRGFCERRCRGAGRHAAEAAASCGPRGRWPGGGRRATAAPCGDFLHRQRDP